MVVFAIASFGCTLPHFIFGDELLHSNNAFYSGGSTSLTEIMIKDANGVLTSTSRTDSNLNLCKFTDNISFNGTGEKRN